MHNAEAERLSRGVEDSRRSSRAEGARRVQTGPFVPLDWAGSLALFDPTLRTFGVAERAMGVWGVKKKKEGIFLRI